MKEKKIRIQKILSMKGIASRRKAEKMILQGEVSVNGKIIKELGTKADPFRDHIKVSNKLITKSESLTYILLHKPKGCITTLNDPLKRPKVMDLVSDIKVSIKPVGRLDYNTEGLLLLTNDGDLINKLIHPSYKVEKEYLTKIKGIPAQKSIDFLKKGVRIDKGKTLPAKVSIVRIKEKNCWIKIIITEGKNLQIKKMCQAIGHSVLKLIRVRYAFLNLKGVGVGSYRHLTEKEVEKLKGL